MPLDLVATTPLSFFQDMKPDMQRKRIYIQAAEQISIQQPLSEQWMEDPIHYKDVLVKAVNPSFRDYLAPNDVRRMGNLMKRALVATLKVLDETQKPNPEAIITGTSLGSLDYSERFLDALIVNDEQTLSPTYFMQSTHNTVGSTLSIYTKNHGYNTTYSHGALSFDLALLDAWMQMQLDKISTALVGGYDEMVDNYFELLRKTGYVGVPGMVPCSETTMSMMLNTNVAPDHLCELAGICILHRPDANRLKTQVEKLLSEAKMSRADISSVITGVNGNADNDKPYLELAEELFPDKPLLHYKHIFGENHTSSALGVYAAAHCLNRGTIPSFMYDSRHTFWCEALQNILFVNITRGREYSFVLLKKP